MFSVLPEKMNLNRNMRYPGWRTVYSEYRQAVSRRRRLSHKGQTTLPIHVSQVVRTRRTCLNQTGTLQCNAMSRSSTRRTKSKQMYLAVRDHPRTSPLLRHLSRQAYMEVKSIDDPSWTIPTAATVQYSIATPIIISATVLAVSRGGTNICRWVRKTRTRSASLGSPRRQHRRITPSTSLNSSRRVSTRATSWEGTAMDSALSTTTMVESTAESGTKTECRERECFITPAKS